MRAVAPCTDPVYAPMEDVSEGGGWASECPPICYCPYTAMRTSYQDRPKPNCAVITAPPEIEKKLRLGLMLRSAGVRRVWIPDSKELEPCVCSKRSVCSGWGEKGLGINSVMVGRYRVMGQLPHSTARLSVAIASLS